MFRLTVPFVLASASPRRRDLLAEVGLHPEILPADGLSGFCEPSPDPGEDPVCYVTRCAAAKAQVVAAHRPGCVVLGADTIVVLPEPEGPLVLGKPADTAAALAMLRRLNGRTHQVITGCCLTGPAPDACDSFHLITDVEFLRWPDAVLAAYAATGEGLDKAGAYAIQGQGAFLSAGIRGSWSTVVGLPVSHILENLFAKGLLCPDSQAPDKKL